MGTSNFELTPNPLVKYLRKPSHDFSRADIIKYIENNGIRIINFRYTGGDGRLKALNFIIQSRKHLETLLASGERVDGSSLFNFLEAGSSDLYVVPRLRTAFLNPFSEVPALDVLCSYYDRFGNPLAGAPENVMRKARQVFVDQTGYNLEVMGEIEFYVISKKNDLYRATDQKGYHESGPFVKWEKLRLDAMLAMAKTGAYLKYGHSEVGNFSNEEFDFEQNEIEFLPTDVEDAASQLIIAKWILRETGYRHGVTVSFAPKINSGKAGSGLHIHMRPMKNGTNYTLENDQISDVAKKIISGILSVSPALSAFGNTVPTSYLRLVPNMEAPTSVCWGERNRSTLIRVPLGWVSAQDMVAHANPLEMPFTHDLSDKQTFELRSPDGSADIYLLLAGILTGARVGFGMPDWMEYSKRTYAAHQMSDADLQNWRKSLAVLPGSCREAAHALMEKADIFGQYGVFPDDILHGVAERLSSFQDENLRDAIADNPEETMKLAQKFLHCG